MPDNKEYVKLWTSYSAYFEPLGDAEVGRLARAMIEYKSSGAEPKFSGNERFVWPAIKRDMDEAERAIAEFRQKQSENGAQGGRPKKPTASHENPKNPSLFPETQKSQGLRTMDYGQGTRDYGQEDLSIPDGIDCRADVRRVVEAWNAIGLQKVTKLLPETDRYKMLKARIAQYGLEAVLQAIENVRQSDFLQGKTGKKPFYATFEWVMRPNNFPKVLEGNYNNTGGKNGTPDNPYGRIGKAF